MANSYELPYDTSDLNWSSAGKNFIQETVALTNSIYKKNLHPLKMEKMQ